MPGEAPNRESSYWKRAWQAGHITIIGPPGLEKTVYPYFFRVAKKLNSFRREMPSGSLNPVTAAGSGWLIRRAPSSSSQLSPLRSTHRI